MLIHAATDNDIHPPLFGATQRTFGLLRGLARRHEVRALCVVPNRNQAPAEEQVLGVTILRRRAWYTSLWWRLERLGVAPLFAAAWQHDARAREWRAALGGAPDVIAVDLHLAGLLRGAGDALKVHTSHNVEADHFVAAGPRVMARSTWARMRARMESRAVGAADLVVVCGEEDAARMRERYGVPAARLLVIPNGYDETRVAPAPAAARGPARAQLGIGEREYACLFLGSDVPHNRAGLERLVGEVLPPLAGQGFRLVVVGSVSRALPAHRPDWLLAHEETADLAPFMAAADAGLNPVSAGGGSNVKVPTYLAAGLAVVSTPFGMRGYGDLARLVTVAEPREMTAAIRERPVGWAARGTATPPEVAGYAWGRLGERLGETLEVLRSGRAAGAAERETRVGRSA